MAEIAESPRVLVLTADVDPTADRVMDQLARRGVPFTRLDPSRFPSELGLTASLDGSGQWSGRISGCPREVDLAALKSIWLRRPGPVGVVEQTSISHESAKWCERQASEGLYGVLGALSGACWVNPPDASRRATSKAFHLAAAASAGLHVPPTLITNDPAAVTKFADGLFQADRTVVPSTTVLTKPLHARSTREITGELSGVLYTERVQLDDWLTHGSRLPRINFRPRFLRVTTCA